MSLDNEEDFEPPKKYKSSEPQYGKRFKDFSHILEPKDHREKWYGYIETLISNQLFCGKRIFMRAHSESSLEYHVKKSEFYFVLDGLLKVQLRTGRAEDNYVLIRQGKGFYIPAGLMHRRMTEEFDTTFIEISTPDADSDSNIVEDARKPVQGYSFSPTCQLHQVPLVFHFYDRPGGPPGNGWCCPVCQSQREKPTRPPNREG